MSNYFSYFPTTFYKNDTLGDVHSVTNITSRLNIVTNIRNNPNFYDEYTVNDGDTPEILAHRFYGDPEKHWVVLMMNDIVDPQFDWPLKENTLISYIDNKYTANANGTMSGLRWAQSNDHSYYKIVKKTDTSTGVFSLETTELDLENYANTSVGTSDVTLSNGTRITIDVNREIKTYYNYEVETNDNKRLVKILRREFVPLVNQELQKVFR
jgi:hypothetical protein